MRLDARPWYPFRDIVTLGLLPTLINVVQTYFKEMERYISGYLDEVNCITFNERRWLEFKALFLRIYRQPSVLMSTGNRVAVVKVTFSTFKNLAAKMNVGSPKGSCYLLESNYDANRVPKDWTLAKNNPFRPREIGVGTFNWWGATEMLQTLDTPEKDVSTTPTIFANPQ